MKPKRITLAARLKTLRESNELTQESVRKALKYKSVQFISNWERGLATIPAKVVPALAKIYKIKAESLIDLMVADYKERALTQAGLR